MANRYSDINRGTELKLAQDNLEAYRKTRKTKKTQANPQPGKARPKTDLIIRPFDSRTPDLVIVSASQLGFEKLRPEMLNRVASAEITASTAIKISNFRAARINYFEPSSNTRNYVKSKQTGLNYLKYPGETFSCPFGALNATEEEAEVAKLVKASVLGKDRSKTYRRAWYVSEQFKI